MAATAPWDDRQTPGCLNAFGRRENQLAADRRGRIVAAFSGAPRRGGESPSQQRMKNSSRLDQCMTFINSQLQPSRGTDKPPRLAITVSRQAGAGAWEIAPRLARILEATGPQGGRPWAVFDRELVERVLEDHDLPAKLAKFMPEDRLSYVQNAVQELLGLHPPVWELAHKTTDTIMRLATVGNVILIGRGASIVTSRLRHMFHVRLIGSEEARLKRLLEHRDLDEAAAREFLEKTDRGRHRYVKEYFRADVAEPLLYDLTINTDRITAEQAAELIAGAALERIGWCTAAAA